MPHLASTRKQFATDVENRPSIKSLQKANLQGKSQKAINNIQDDATEEYQLMNITTSGEATPWNVSFDKEGITVSMQLDTGASDV